MGKINSKASKETGIPAKPVLAKETAQTPAPAPRAPAVQPAPIIATAPPAEPEPQPVTPPTPASGDDQILNLIPAEALFALRINNLDAALMSMDQYLLGVSPVQVTMLAKMQLGNLLNDPALTGIDTAGDFAAFAIMPPITADNMSKPQPIPAVIIPVTGTDFADKHEEAVQLNDSYALFAPAAQSTEDLDYITQKIQSHNLITLLDAEEYDRAITAPFWAYGNLPQINGIRNAIMYLKRDIQV